jgi:rhodanese-related sulfurtransferase
VALALMEAGFDDVHALYGGLEAWKKAGGPTEPKTS